MIFKILILEDEESIHLLYYEYFKKIKISNVEIKYVIVSNLYDAKVQCDIFEPDCILLDLELNGIQMDGLNISKIYDIDKCIIISGLLDYNTIIKCNSLGFFKFLCKPFNYKNLEIIITQFYNNYKLYIDLAHKDEDIRRKFQENMILVDDLQDQYYLQDTILSIIPAIIYIKDVNLKYVTVNNKFLEINNITNINSVIGKTDFEIFDIDKATKYSTEDQNIIKFNIESLNILNHSNSRSKFEWILISKYPIFHENKVSGIIAVIIDITSSVQLEKIIEDTFNAIKDGICVIDSNKKIIKVNNALTTWYSDQLPLIGKYCIDVFFNNECDICIDCPNKSKIYPCIVQYNNHWFEVEYYPIKDTQYTICYRRDITKHKLLEEKIKLDKINYEAKLSKDIDDIKSQWLINSSEFNKNLFNSNKLLSSISLPSNNSVLDDK
jgi:PAS domain-containing protein